MRGTPKSAEAAKAGIWGAAVGFVVTLLVAVSSDRYPAWLKLAALVWLTLGVAWYAFWLGRLPAQKRVATAERQTANEVWRPPASNTGVDEGRH